MVVSLASEARHSHTGMARPRGGGLSRWAGCGALVCGNGPFLFLIFFFDARRAHGPTCRTRCDLPGADVAIIITTHMCDVRGILGRITRPPPKQPGRARSLATSI